MNDSRVGTGSPLHPPIAITAGPEETSSAAADWDPFVAADHWVWVAANMPARSALLPSSPVQLPSWIAPFSSAAGMEPWCGVAAVAIEKALGPPIAASIPTTTAVADIRRAPTAIPHTAAAAATAMITHGSQAGPNMLRRSRTPDHIAVR